MRNKAGISKGFAFVSFFTHNEAQKALSCLHEHVIEGSLNLISHYDQNIKV